MSLDKARSYYLGANGSRRANCAQAVFYAFQDKFSVSPEKAEAMAFCGGGRAPEGRCGSLHAARVLLDPHHPDLAEACERFLSKRAGAVSCREIRSGRKLSCQGCVETVAEFMENV